MKNCIREAAHLGARWVRVFSGKDPGDARRAEAKSILVDSLLQICEFAREHNDPGLTLKIFDRAIDKEFLIGPYQDALDVVTAVRASFPSFGVLVDLSHFSLLQEDPAVTLPALRPYLRHVHIGNAYTRDRRHIAYGDLQPRFDFPDGEVTTSDVAEFFRRLVDLGFFNPTDRPVCSAEVRPLVAGERPELIVANAKRVMEEAWALA
jgi:sugar phosphate isomerase/epimerase